MVSSAEPLPPSEAEAARDIVRWVLGEAVVGVYLFGSALMGGRRPNSDVNLLVIVATPPAELARKHLVAELMTVSGRPEQGGSPRPLEVTLLCLEELVPWRYPPRCELIYGEWLRDEFENGWVPPPEPTPDLAIVLTKARAHSVPLIGPELGELIAPIPGEDLRRALADSLPGLIPDEQDKGITSV